MLRTLLRDEHNHFRVVDDPSAISEIVEHKNRLLWLDLENPDAKDFDLIQEEFGLHPLAIEDARTRHQRPKIEQYETFYLVIFYSVAVEEPGAEGTIPGTRGLRATAFHRPGEAVEEFVTGDGKEKSIPLPPLSTPTQQPENGNGQTSEVPADASPRLNERLVLRELTLFMGGNYLITVHTHPLPELDEAARRWRRNAELIGSERSPVADVPGTRQLTPQEQRTLSEASADGSGSTTPGPMAKRNGQSPQTQAEDVGILLYSLLDSIVDSYFPVLDSVVERVEDLEEQIFERFNQQAIESIFTLKKDLLALRKVLAPERDVLNVLIRRDLPIFEQHTLVYFQDVYDHVVRITDSIDTYRDLLSSALDSYLSMQSNRLNITVQTLTSVSIILMSIAAVSGWYGMNFAHMPELASPWGYPIVIASVAIIVVLEVLFFKRKGWL
jgi:Mg2+ and Co2+ transporter CorA